MRFYSTSNKKTTVSLKEAVFKGLAPDGGLFMPVRIPKLPKEFFNKRQSDFKEIAFEVAKALFADEVDEAVLRKIVEESYDFEIPLIEIEKNVYSLELFHGPTLAFKDFAGRFMARLIGHFLENGAKELTVLAATSGDTGSAVASGFHKLKKARVVLLYPSGKVSEIQEKQLTTMGGNVKALEVKGNFDDCQRMVKEAFVDKDINHKICLASANSINIARLFPQTFYHFYTYFELKKKRLPLVISVPCGNFGNLTAGLIAKKMGLPIYKFIASTNANDAFPRYLKSGKFSPKKSKETLSNAMDIGNPNNFPRILELYGGDIDEIRKDIYSQSFTDSQTKEAIKEVYLKDKYIMDPHGAVAYLGLKAFLKKEFNAGLRKQQQFAGVFLETAHPAKFKDTVEEVIGKKIDVPKRLSSCLKKEKKAKVISNQFEELKRFLLRMV